MATVRDTHSWGAGLTTPVYREVQDRNNGGIGTTIQGDLASGEARINNSTSAAQSGVAAATAAAGAARGDAASMRNQAQLVNTQAGAVNSTADALAGLVPQLDPYRDTLTGYGDDLNALANSLTEQAKDVFGQGGALVNMDRSKGGLSAEYMSMYDLLSPDRYVSRAASDVQGSYANALGQQNRNLARQGVSAGSGAAMGLTQQFNRVLATALAAAKTNARQQGITEKSAFLDKMTSAANTLYNMGNQTQAQALSAQGLAGDMQNKAAGIITQQGGLLQDAGALRAQAGQLYSNAASIFGSAGGLELDAGKLEESAYQALASAEQAAANYYLGAANAMKNTGRTGGATVSQAEPDFWESTGHSSTWWKNNDYDTYTQLAQQAAAQTAKKK